MKPTTFLNLLTLAHLTSAQATAGVTTRFWDCCKPSCSWSGKAAFSSPVTTCDIHDKPLASGSIATSGCDGGGVAFMCSSQQPFACNSKLAYGFAAVSGSLSEAETCCACYKLIFTSGPITGNTMVVQAINIGYDVASMQFDLAIPGGGVGAFTSGCSTEWNAPSTGWGQQYGGVSSISQCSTLPSVLQPGCDFRFDWMQSADNPSITYERVACPAELLAKTNCKRDDDGGYPAAPKCGKGGGGGTKTHISKQTSARNRTKTTRTSTKTSSATPPMQTLYGQCAGIGYTGPTKCPSGSTCQYQNDCECVESCDDSWLTTADYSQCLPA